MTGLRYLSVCSGIEAASVAWHPLGWRPVGFSEIDPFPRAVLAHHYPEVPCHGDFSTIGADDYGQTDLLVGGTPCQDNSVGYSAGAGVPGLGLGGLRSGLAFEFARLAARKRVRWFVWENVPNILCRRLAPSFGRLVTTFVELGFGVAWRVLDARGCGWPRDQPRRRLIMVGYRGDAATAGAVLFEHPGAGRNCEAIADAAPVLTARGGMALDDRTPTILDEHGPRIATPREWERAMGFPDDYTLVPYRGRPAPDGPRYKALGNSMHVAKMRWLGQRIQAIEEMLRGEAERVEVAA